MTGLQNQHNKHYMNGAFLLHYRRKVIRLHKRQFVVKLICEYITSVGDDEDITIIYTL